MKSILKYAIIILTVGFIFSCKKDTFNTNSNAKLLLRTDTVWFDTVFTRFNPQDPRSVNKQILVVNPHDQMIRTSIHLGGGVNSYFRMNVDGEPGHFFEDIEIFPNDSLFIFLEAHPEQNLDPMGRPLIVKDSILFTTNGNIQQTNLIAWGQDAHYFKRDSTTTASLTWDDKEKVYVVYDYFYVRPNEKLIIEEGVTIHFNPGAWLFVEGELEVNGTCTEKVRFEGDRLQPSFEEVAGQWGGIWLSYPNSNSKIDHAIIKNGTVGIYMDSLSSTSDPNATVTNTFVRNMLFDGIAGRNSHAIIENSIFANCGRFTFLGERGGRYEIDHCTFYTGSSNFSRQDPTWVVTNTTRDPDGFILDEHDIYVTMKNSIVDGSQDSNELAFALVNTSKVTSIGIFNNLLNTALPNSIIDNSSNVKFIEAPDSLFVNPFKHDYELVSDALARDIGVFGLTQDLECRSRSNPPDAGALEGQ